MLSRPVDEMWQLCFLIDSETQSVGWKIVDSCNLIEEIKKNIRQTGMLAICPGAMALLQVVYSDQ